MNTDVSIVRCDEYEAETCRRALGSVLAPLGGLDWVQPGMRIAVKVNLVSAMPPEDAATVHPTLLCELVRMLTARGASVVLGDSPGGLYTPAHLAHVYDVTGMHECEKYGAQLNQDFSQAIASFPDAVCAHQFTYTAWLDKADAIIDFCKLKSHGMMGMSNAAKNLFGVIPGTMKPEYHYKYPDAGDFSNMLIDLNEYFKPRLCICDAVVCMEGNGPTQGTPVHLGAIAAAYSSHKLDLLCADLIGLTVKDVPTLSAALARGLIPPTAAELHVCGDYAALRKPDFDVPEAQKPIAAFHVGSGIIGKITASIARRAFRSDPSVHAPECIGCGKCANICPAKAIVMERKLPKIDRARCIHCFCCQEFCPKGAMKVRRTFIARLLNR